MICEVLASTVLKNAREKNLKLASAESCTGGMIGASLTDVAGSSDVYERGFITYSNEAKNELLGVPLQIITRHGAVSEECARAMAQGALEHSHADVALSVTGIAGPGGGSEDKPVGLVWFGVVRNGMEPQTIHHVFDGKTRAEIRMQATQFGLNLMLQTIHL